jgi:DNA-binding NarL/FixJ family response regulator
MPKSEAAIRALLVEDHLVLRTALRLLLTSESNLEVVGEAADRATALALATQQQPDIILLDLHLEDGESFELIPQIRAAAPQAGVLVLTGANEPQLQRRAIAEGALGLVSKTQSSNVLLETIQRVCAGETWIDRSLLSAVFTQAPHTEVNDPITQQIATLTQRELEVISLISEGLRNKEIAKRLFLSERTVHNHPASIFRKLSVSDRLELAVFAQRYGLGNVPQ